MSLSLQKRNKLASLGRQVALTVQSGDAQEPEWYILVSGQIRGYLRWYGDLTGAIGYWPLDEAIVYALEEGACPAAGLHAGASDGPISAGGGAGPADRLQVQRRPNPCGPRKLAYRRLLNAMGMPPHSEGQAVLEAALRLARAQPNLLSGMADKFYPTLGKGLCESPDNASRHVRAAIDRLSECPNSADFFDFAGLSGGTANHCQRFFEAFLRYMAL